MGTNYYWRDQPCEHCGRWDEMHVCKSGSTWHGYRHELFNPQNPEWGYDPQSPLGFPIVSVADWRTVFTERPGELWDEYDRRIEDPLAWLADMRPPEGEARANKLRWHLDGFADGRDWWDPEGFHFYGGEFS